MRPKKCIKLMFKYKNARQGIHKRSLANVYHLFEVEDKPSLVQCSDERSDAGASMVFTDFDGKDVYLSSVLGRARGTGLVRSQSFPPEGWYKTTSKYILRINKTLSPKDSERHCNKSGNESEDNSCCRAVVSEPKNVSSDSTSPTMVVSAFVANLAPEQVFNEPTVPVSAVNNPVAGINKVRVLPSGNEATAVITEEGANDVFSGTSSMAHDMVDIVHPHPSSPSPTAEEPTSTNLPIPALMIPPSGKLLVCGRRREMEDTASIVPSFLSCGNDEAQLGKDAILNWHFFGVFDGHGGSQASTYCMERLHRVVAEELLQANSFVVPEGQRADVCNVEWDEVMKTAFLRIDKEVGGVCPNKVCGEDEVGFNGGCLCCEDAVAPENVGTTAIVAVVGLHQVVVANCGDSRAVLVRGGQAIPLSRDHKPELEDETRRIEAAGGRVISWDGYRVGGLLALSRAIGDRYLKQYVISEPEITCTPRSEDDECLILASDGMWDVLSNKFACEVARKSLPAFRKKYASRSCAPGEDAAAAAVAALLVKLAYGRGSKDNITVVVVDLKSRDLSHQS